MEPTSLDRSSTVRDSKRLSSRRSLKPRQNFSPEPVRKKPVSTTRFLGETHEQSTEPVPSTSKFLDHMRKMDQLKQIGSIPETEFQLPRWLLEDDDDLVGGGLIDLEEEDDIPLEGDNDYRDHKALVKMQEYDSNFIENEDDGDDDDDDYVDDLLEEEPEPQTTPINDNNIDSEPSPSPIPPTLDVDDKVEEPRVEEEPLESTSSADLDQMGSDEDNIVVPSKPSPVSQKLRFSKRGFKQISTSDPEKQKQEEEKKPLDDSVEAKQEKEEVPSKKKKLIPKKQKVPIQRAAVESLASGRPQRNRRQPMQMNDFYCPTFSFPSVAKPKLAAKTVHTPSPKTASKVKQEVKIKSDPPVEEQQEALVPELSKSVSDSPICHEVLVSPVPLDEVAAALARASNQMVDEVECEPSRSERISSSPSSSVQWVYPEEEKQAEQLNKPITPIPIATQPEVEETEETKDTDSVISLEDLPVTIPNPTAKPPIVKEKVKPVERLSSAANARPTIKINYTNMLKKRGILPQFIPATNLKGKKTKPHISKKIPKEPKPKLESTLSSSSTKLTSSISSEQVDEPALLQPPAGLALTAMTPVHQGGPGETKEMDQSFASPSTSVAPLSPAKSITASGRPQRHRSTPHSTDYYYPSINPSTATGSSSHTKLPSLTLTSRQITASSSNSTKATPESAPVVMPEKASSGQLPVSPVASPPVVAPAAAAVLSPEKKRTDSGLALGAATALGVSSVSKPQKTRKEYTKRPGPIYHHRPSAPTPNQHKTSLQQQRKSLAEPLSINISNHTHSSSNRSSASRQLLSSSSTSNTPVMSPKLHNYNHAHPRYPIYGAAECGGRDTHLSFFQRMHERKKLNVLAIGLNMSTTYKKKLDDLERPLVQESEYPEEYFYKEILMKPSKMKEQQPPKSPTSEEECSQIDVDGLDISQFPQDELISSNPAEACARDVLLAVKSKFAPMEEDNWERNGPDQASDGETDCDLNVLLMHRANQEPREVQEHLVFMLKYIFVQRLTDISTHNVIAGTSMFYSNSLANANRLRESLKLYSKQRLASILVAHNWLLERLNVYLLAAYLNLLRFLKVAGSGLSEHLVKESYKDKHKDFERANEYIKEFLAPKIYDPPTNSLSKIMSCDPLKNVSLVLVYPQISSNGSHPTSVRPYESMFRNLLPRVAQCVEKVDLTMNAADLVSIETCTLQCLNIIQKRVREIVKRRPNDHIFLAGWGTSCLLNHKVVSLVPGVSGLLNFAFPVDSATGPRGDVEDEICLTYCPSLFVVGENAADVNFEALQNMRKNIIVDSGLIVVGAANHNLFVSQLRLNIERISQKCVERTIVEHTVDFMKQVMSDLGPQSSKECREMLKPVTLQNIYDVDITALRCRPNPPIAGVPRPRKNASNSQTGLKQSLVKAFDAKPHNKPSSNLKSLHVQSVCSTSSTFHAPQQPSPLSLQSYGPITSSKEGHHPLSTHNSGFGVPSPPAARPAPLLSARTSLNSSLKKVSGDPLRIPTPSMLNLQLPPPMPTEATMRDEQSEQLRMEEEEAAAAIMDTL